MKNKETKITVCACYSPEHQIIFRPIKETNTYGDKTVEVKEVYVDIHLRKIPFFKRIVYAIQYIFGRTCSYGAFDEIIINEENYHNFKEVVEFFEEPKESIEIKEE